MATLSVKLITISLLLLIFCLEHGLGTQISRPFLFSGKTRYHFSPKPIEKPPRCEAVHINMVIRHGSRYPASALVRKMKALLDAINRRLPNNSTIRYKGLSLPWSIPSDILNSASKELSSLGSEEMYSIAKRFLAKFPNTFTHSYSNSNYSFVATDKLRSSQSAMAFAQGLFEGRGHLGPGKYQPVAVKFSGSYDDDISLRIFEACPKWQRLAAKVNVEYVKFLNGPEMRGVLKNISARLKLGKEFSLRPSWAVEMFLMCAFGIQTDSADSSWCDLFEEPDLKVLEYLHDLKLYWDRSYGREINYKMSCPLYGDITDSFERFLVFRKPHGVFRIAHTGTVIPLLTMLGLYNDTVPPRADNFHRQADRKFRISNVVPMGGNVAFVLYHCKSGNAGAQKESNCKSQCHRSADKERAFRLSHMKIQLLVNEAAVQMPACGGRMYCSLEQFFNYYSHIKRSCNIKKICGTRKGKCNKVKKRPRD